MDPRLGTTDSRDNLNYTRQMKSHQLLNNTEIKHHQLQSIEVQDNSKESRSYKITIKYVFSFSHQFTINYMVSIDTLKS